MRFMLYYYICFQIILYIFSGWIFLHQKTVGTIGKIKLVLMWNHMVDSNDKETLAFVMDSGKFN